MQISVRDILSEPVGYSRSYKISGETPDLESVRLTRPVEGEVSIARLEDGLRVRGRLSSQVQLECHRCLSAFERAVQVKLSQVYREDPEDDDRPITGGQIELGPLLEQEIVLTLPIKILCKPDCQGIEIPEVKYTKDNEASLGNRARITKGNKRGRT